MVTLSADQVDAFQVEVCNRLRAAWEDSRESLESLGDRIGMHKSTLSNILAGNKNSKLESVDRIAKGLGMTLSEALGGPEAKSGWSYVKARLMQYKPEGSWVEMGTLAGMDGSGLWLLSEGKRHPLIKTVPRLAGLCAKRPHEMVLPRHYVRAKVD